MMNEGVCGAATLSGDAAIARVLAERGADVNRRDNEGNTVLMVTINFSSFNLLESHPYIIACHTQ